MKKTKTPRTAMLRLAEALGWDVKSIGRQWIVTNLPCAKGLKYSAIALLCFMTRVAMSPEAYGGLGLSRESIREKIRFRPTHIYDPKSFRHYLKLPTAIAAADETTLYQAYFNPEGVDHV